MDKTESTLFQPNILDILKEDGKTIDSVPVSAEDFFLVCIGLQFSEIARRFGCKLFLNEDKVVSAQKRWVDDVKNQRIGGGGIPDQYKQSGLLAYWLRRKQVVDTCEKIVEYDSDYAKNHQNHFLNTPCETSSFLLGFNLSAYYTFPRHKREDYGLEAYMRDCRATDPFIYDVGHYLESKHVSPHSLYLIYRAFFETSLTFRRGIVTYS